MTSDGSAPCCGGARDGGQAPHEDYVAAAMAVPVAAPDVQAEIRSRLQSIPGGIFEMGARKSTYPNDLDSPRSKVRVSPFLMSPHTVTNAEFARFFAETGYRTVAECEGWSFVFHLLLDDPDRWPITPPGLPWWRRVDGAHWAMPEGPGSDVSDRQDHPAVHIAWSDALAYGRWSGLRLPREAEWERAARGGLQRMKFPLGQCHAPRWRVWHEHLAGRFPA